MPSNVKISPCPRLFQYLYPCASGSEPRKGTTASRQETGCASKCHPAISGRPELNLHFAERQVQSLKSKPYQSYSSSHKNLSSYPIERAGTCRQLPSRSLVQVMFYATRFGSRYSWSSSHPERRWDGCEGRCGKGRSRAESWQAGQQTGWIVSWMKYGDRYRVGDYYAASQTQEGKISVINFGS